MANHHTDFSAADHLNEVMRRPCPCDACPLARRCGAELLCCQQFARYVLGRNAAYWRAAKREPSAERFARLYAPTDDKPPAVRSPYRRNRLADSQAAWDWISPGQVEKRLGICAKTRATLERTGKLPPRDAQLGKRTGWRLETIAAVSLPRGWSRPRAAGPLAPA